MLHKPEWQKRLEHDRVVRDALVACGNPKPDRPDPPGGLVLVVGKVFKGDIFLPYLEKHGHTTSVFNDCACFRK